MRGLLRAVNLALIKSQSSCQPQSQDSCTEDAAQGIGSIKLDRRRSSPRIRIEMWACFLQVDSDRQWQREACINKLSVKRANTIVPKVPVRHHGDMEVPLLSICVYLGRASNRNRSRPPGFAGGVL